MSQIKHICFLCQYEFLQMNSYGAECPHCKINIFEYSADAFCTLGKIYEIRVAYQESIYNIYFAPNYTFIHKAVKTDNGYRWSNILCLDYPIPLTTNVSMILALS